jgi:hypothetical protein
MNSQPSRTGPCSPSVCLRVLFLALVFCLTVPAQEKSAPPGSAPSGAGSRQDPTALASASTNAAEPADRLAEDVIRLFDGKTLLGWREAQFPASGKVKVEEGKIILGTGYMTGITLTNEVPRSNYEVSLEAMRVEGGDFFCALTFPVEKDPCTLIVGGWGGSLVGLSCLDYMDASSNETTQMLKFENGRWYKIRLRVVPGKIQAWIDKEKVIDVNTTDRKISIRTECEPCLPFGIATWSTTAALRSIVLRHL